MDNFLITFSINILFSTCLLHSILASTALKPQSYCCWGTWYIRGTHWASLHSGCGLKINTIWLLLDAEPMWVSHRPERIIQMYVFQVLLCIQRLPVWIQYYKVAHCHLNLNCYLLKLNKSCFWFLHKNFVIKSVIHIIFKTFKLNNLK